VVLNRSLLTRRRAAAAGTTLVFLAAGATSLTATAAPAAKRCKASEVTRTITYARKRGGRRIRITACGPRSTARPATLPATLVAAHKALRRIALQLAPARIAPLARSRAARRVQAADAPADAALGARLAPLAHAAGGARPVPLAHAAGVVRSDESKTTHSPPGTTTTERKVGALYDADDPEPGSETVVTTDTRSTRIAGLSSSKAKKVELVNRISRCPDAGGVAHGRLRFVDTETFMMDKPGGGRGTITVTVTFDAKIAAQFDDNARIASAQTTGGWTWSTTTRLSPGGEQSRHTATSTVTATTLGAPSPTGNGRSVSFDTSISSADDAMAVPAGVLGPIAATFMPEIFASQLLADVQSRALSGICMHIVPDPATVHVRPGGQVTLGARLKDYDGAEATGPIRVLSTAAGATVTPDQAQAEPRATYTYFALPTIPPGGKDVVALEHTSKRGRSPGNNLTVIYDQPTTKYTGTFSGRWDGEATGEHWSYTGTVELAYGGPAPAPPPGAGPFDAYNIYEITTGTADVTVIADSPFGCGFKAIGQTVALGPASAVGRLYVGAGDAAPYTYHFGLMSQPTTITVTKTGADASCHAGTTAQYPLPSPWASTATIRTSPSATLADEEDHATPETPFDYDAFSKWSLAPS
jgi:hypothetical protein